MTAWDDFSLADFDKTRAPRGAAKRAAQDAAAGQAGLFHVPTPVLPAEPAPGREELPGQAGLFETDETE